MKSSIMLFLIINFFNLDLNSSGIVPDSQTLSVSLFIDGNILFFSSVLMLNSYFSREYEAETSRKGLNSSGCTP
jgi:hypothetical protein